MTPVLSDGLDAFVFTFSFFGLRTSRFDFCCLAIGWVTSIAGRPALGNGTAVCPCGPATGMVDQAGTAPDRLCGFWCDVCRKRRDLDIATVERECNGSLLGAQAGLRIFAGATSGMTMKLVEGRVVRALASRRDVKNPSSGAAGRGARCVSQCGQRLFARPLLLFRSAGLLLLGVRLWLAVLRLVRWLWFLWGGHEFHSLFKCCQPGHSVRRGNRQLGLSLWTAQTSCRRGQRQRRLRIFGGYTACSVD